MTEKFDKNLPIIIEDTTEEIVESSLTSEEITLPEPPKAEPEQPKGTVEIVIDEHAYGGYTEETEENEETEVEEEEFVLETIAVEPVMVKENPETGAGFINGFGLTATILLLIAVMAVKKVRKHIIF